MHMSIDNTCNISDQTLVLGETVTLTCELKQTAIDDGMILNWVICGGGNDLQCI